MRYAVAVVSQAILTGISVAICAAVVMPLDRRYRAWKASRPAVTLRRNWRGRLVPDLRVKRAERAVLIAIAAIAMLGLAIGFTIMAP